MDILVYCMECQYTILYPHSRNNLLLRLELIRLKLVCFSVHCPQEPLRNFGRFARHTFKHKINYTLKMAVGVLLVLAERRN